jgi:hypothetical protein
LSIGTILRLMSTTRKFLRETVADLLLIMLLGTLVWLVVQGDMAPGELLKRLEELVGAQ